MHAALTRACPYATCICLQHLTLKFAQDAVDFLQLSLVAVFLSLTIAHALPATCVVWSMVFDCIPTNIFTDVDRQR